MDIHESTGGPNERRQARRYGLSLPVEVRLHSRVDPPGSMVFTTTNISRRGFHFNSDRKFDVGLTFDFSILSMPPEDEPFALIRGRARTVRSDELPNGDFGVGAVIEETVHLDEIRLFTLPD